jgi:Fe-S-cluster containining protein
MTELFDLHRDIDQRVAIIRDAHPDWPCSKGCDACCRQLAALPRLTRAEWEWLKEGLASLTPDQFDAIRERLMALGPAPRRPVTCPLLDPASGACPVYAYRPVACRTYGFYVQRDKGLFCGTIQAHDDNGELAELVWGNHETVDRRLTGFGETRSLDDWFKETE